MLTIHVGLHKTGSTALQKGLASLGPRTSPNIYYRGNFSAAANDGFFRPGFGFHVPPDANRTRTVRLLGSGRSVVLSHEGFLGSAYQPRPGAMYSGALTLVESIRNYFEELTPFQLVVYLRPQHQWLESVYNQYVKGQFQYGNGQLTPGAVSPTVFAETLMNAPYFRWSRLVADLRRQLGAERLIVRAYQPHVDIATDFFSILGVSTPESLLERPRENTALTAERIAVLEWLTAHFEQTGGRNLAWLVQSVSHAGHRTRLVKYSPFSEAIQYRLKEMTTTDWQELYADLDSSPHSRSPDFLQIARESEREEIKPPADLIGDSELSQEALHLLADSLVYLRSHPRLRFADSKRRAMQIRDLALSGPLDVPTVASRFLRSLTK